MGAAMALYSATCYALGRYGNGNPYPVNLKAIIGLSGWLPGARYLRHHLEHIPLQTNPHMHPLLFMLGMASTKPVY
jgi:lysophospholipase-2